MPILDANEYENEIADEMEQVAHDEHVDSDVEDDKYIGEYDESGSHDDGDDKEDPD